MGIFSMNGKLAKFLNTLGSLFLLNLCALLCCVPVFTVGAAMTALYSCTLRLVRGEEGSPVKDYFNAFRENFPQATKVWLVGGCLIAFMAFDIRLLRSLSGTFGQVYRILLFALILFFALELIYSFALMARFQNTTRNTLKNALILSLGKPVNALGVLLLTALPVGVLMISYRFLPVLFLLGLSGPAYLAGIYFTTLFKPYE